MRMLPDEERTASATEASALYRLLGTRAGDGAVSDIDERLRDLDLRIKMLPFKDGRPAVIDIRSSWTINSRGHSTRIDMIDPHRIRAEGHDYRCGACERGHSRRTCGREPKR